MGGGGKKETALRNHQICVMLITNSTPIIIGNRIKIGLRKNGYKMLLFVQNQKSSNIKFYLSLQKA